MNNPIVVKIQTSGYNYRGQIINDLIYLERLIDETISRHFCNDIEKRKEFFELIIANERMSFNSKIQVFEYLFRKYQKNFISNFPAVFSDIKKLNEERNIVAHYLLDTSDDGQEKMRKENKIGFVKFRNSSETLWRDQEDINKWHLLLVKYINALQDFLNT